MNKNIKIIQDDLLPGWSNSSSNSRSVLELVLGWMRSWLELPPKHTHAAYIPFSIYIEVTLPKKDGNNRFQFTSAH